MKKKKEIKWWKDKFFYLSMFIGYTVGTYMIESIVNLTGFRNSLFVMIFSFLYIFTISKKMYEMFSSKNKSGDKVVNPFNI